MCAKGFRNRFSGLACIVFTDKQKNKKINKQGPKGSSFEQMTLASPCQKSQEMYASNAQKPMHVFSRANCFRTKSDTLTFFINSPYNWLN
jgi:hypothetical protein